VNLSSASWVSVPTGYAASADEQARDLKSRLSTRAAEFYPWLDEQLAGFVPRSGVMITKDYYRDSDQYSS
jgi:hypothetical protein